MTFESSIWNLDEQRGFQFLSLRLQKLTTPSYINPRFSILAHSLPLVIDHPAIKNSLLACSFALLAKSTFRLEDYALAKKYYSNALNKLAINLLHSEEDENLATILLLHLFEVIIKMETSRKQS